MLLDLIRSRPGASVTDLMAHVPFQWGSLSYHLRKLAEAGHVHIVSDPSDARRKRVYLLRGGEADVIDPAPRDPHLSKLQLDVARAIQRWPGCDFADLTNHLGIPPRTLHYHLKRLHEQGLVVSGSPSRYRNLRPSARLYQLLGEQAPPGALDVDAFPPPRGFIDLERSARGGEQGGWEGFVDALVRLLPDGRLMARLEQEGISPFRPERARMMAAWKSLGLRADDRARLRATLDRHFPAASDGWATGARQRGALALAKAHQERGLRTYTWVKLREDVTARFQDLDWGAPDAPCSLGSLEALLEPKAPAFSLTVAAVAAEQLAQWGRQADALALLKDARASLGSQAHACLSLFRATVRAYTAEDPGGDLIAFHGSFRLGSWLPTWEAFEPSLALWPSGWFPGLADGIYAPGLPPRFARGLCLEAAAHHTENGAPELAQVWIDRLSQHAPDAKPLGKRSAERLSGQIGEEGREADAHAPPPRKKAR